MGWTSDSLELAMLSDGFDPITLKEMDEVALFNRIDTKFLMTTGQLMDTLSDPAAGLLDFIGQRPAPEPLSDVIF